MIKLATLIVVVRYDISGDEVRDSSQSVTCTTPKMATGAGFGKIEEFSSNKEDWSNYVERLNHFFKANAITTNEQKQFCVSFHYWAYYVQAAEESHIPKKARRQVLQGFGEKIE